MPLSSRNCVQAGAVILGKTNMSEWGYMRSTRGCSGWSSRGGQVRNPYALNRSPSGSSSGSAVAVAANLCTVTLGAEVDGSIVRPSSINGIVGLKPTVGLVSRSGVIGVAAPQDTAGPMARSVADLATVLTVLSGYDPRDPITKEGEAQRAGTTANFWIQRPSRAPELASRAISSVPTKAPMPSWKTRSSR